MQTENRKASLSLIVALLVALLVALSLSVAAHAREGDLAMNTSAVYLADLSLDELMNIEVVSVSKRPEKLSESPSAIQVILDDHIHRSGASSLPEALRLASNLNVAQQNSHEWIISARGFSSDVGNKLLVLMDGRNIYTPLFSGVFWDRQDYVLEDLDRIEVISGPGATIWGANAVNGVINIVSKDAGQTQGWYMHSAAGSALEAMAEVRYGGQISDRAFYRVYGKYTERDNYKLSNGEEGSDAWDMGQTGFRSDIALSASDKLTVQGDYYSNETMLVFGEESETRGNNLLARWVRKLSEDSDFNLQIYFDQTKLSLPTDAVIINGIEFAPAGLFKDKLDTYDLDFSHRFSWGERQKWVWGFEYRHMRNDIHNSPGLGFSPEKLTQELYSAFLQDEIALIKNKLSFTLGSKFEKNDYTGEELEPNARLRWTLNDSSMLWAAVSRAVRIPSRLDRDFSLPNPPNIVLLRGGKNFQSEKVTAWEAGWRAMISDRVIGSISLFYNEYTDVRSTSFTEETILPFYFENNLEGETHGFELSTSIQTASWWQLHVGYNYLIADMRVKEGRFDLNNTYNENADPKHQLSLRSSMELGDDLDLDLSFRHVGELPTNDAGVLTYVPSYNEVDLRLAWQWRQGLELALVGQNLLNDYHQEFGIPGEGQEHISRNVYASLRWRYDQ